MDTDRKYWILLANAGMSVAGFILVYTLIPSFSDMFMKANLFGVDMAKRNKRKIPESMGVVCGAVFLIIMSLFIPVPFYNYLTTKGTQSFPMHEYIQFLAALLSICCMIFLGFADDVFDLRWRHKLYLPTIGSLPLLMVYFVTFDLTIIKVPSPFRTILGNDINLGFLYYVYMGMLAVFCTNAINIYAGVNGLEAGQSFVIAISVIIFNFCELNGEQHEAHTFSLYFMLPYLAVCSALLWYNWYPSQVFVGDTFCYFSGMTFAVVAILGHFSKTLLLFFIPQVFNFVFSCPQIFRIVPCPRHRLPRYNPDTDKVSTSTVKIKSSTMNPLGKIIIFVCSKLFLVKVRESTGEDGQYTEVTNFTLINLLLRFIGPLHERTLVILLLSLQVTCSIIAFLIRYQGAKLFYEVVR